MGYDEAIQRIHARAFQFFRKGNRERRVSAAVDQQIALGQSDQDCIALPDGEKGDGQPLPF